MKSRRWLVVRVGVKISIKNSIKHSTDLLLSTDLLKFDSAVLQNSQGPTAKQFLEEYAIPVICIENLQPAQSGKLLQSHTLMERCRGELLRRGRRKKKEMEHFPGCLNNPPHWFWGLDAGVTLSPKRGREREGEESWKKKQSETKKQKWGKHWLRKVKEMMRSEERGMEQDPLCFNMISNDLCLYTRAWHWRCDWALGQAQISCPCVTKTKNWEVVESREILNNGLLPSCHKRRFCDPEGWVYTHDPAPAHHSPPSLASVPFARLEAESSGNHSPRTCDTF